MNKKQIVKNEVAKYTGKGGSKVYTPRSPFKMMRDFVKNTPGNMKATYWDIPKFKREAMKADIDIDTLKEARKYGNPQSEEGGASSIVDGRMTPAGIARLAALEVKSRRMNQVKK